MNHEIIEMAMQTVPPSWLDARCAYLENFATLVAVKKRNDTLEEVAQEFDKMKVFGDTAASFAIFVREMKS
jgi:uncharacterized surface protein with fasciclin (FAS1) repeats